MRMQTAKAARDDEIRMYKVTLSATKIAFSTGESTEKVHFIEFAKNRRVKLRGGKLGGTAFRPSGVPFGAVKQSRPFRRPVRSRETLPSYYRVTRSSQRTIDSMTSIDNPQAATKTNHVAHIGVCR